jgi:CBS domain containing-hemolysin-like protein
LVEKQISENEFVFSGRLEIDYINEKYRLNLPQSDDYETIAGLIIHFHESIPDNKEEIIIDHLCSTILQASENRIEQVRLKIT